MNESAISLLKCLTTTCPQYCNGFQKAKYLSVKATQKKLYLEVVSPSPNTLFIMAAASLRPCESMLIMLC